MKARGRSQVRARRSSQVPGDVAVTGSGCVTYIGCREHFVSEGQPKRTYLILDSFTQT